MFFGAGIYIGTFITSANIDYRLVLLFTLPIILDYEKQSLKILYMICLIVCLTLIFEVE